tara:strand:+ start:308 stop:637 length:330 start_codon:yes stop_codon:yes gene_type:complete
MTFSDFNNEIYIIMTTEVDKENALKLADLLLKDKLIACVNFKNIESSFWWEGNIKQSKEVQLMIKCKKKNVNNVCNNIAHWHSYKVPEIICFCALTNKTYHDWVDSASA